MKIRINGWGIIFVIALVVLALLPFMADAAVVMTGGRFVFIIVGMEFLFIFVLVEVMKLCIRWGGDQMLSFKKDGLRHTS